MLTCITLISSICPLSASPLQNIINASIKKGEFPSNWKKTVVTPVLKKGDKEFYENYRPVSCLPAAAKLLELVVCQQTSIYIDLMGLILVNLLFVLIVCAFGYLVFTCGTQVL